MIENFDNLQMLIPVITLMASIVGFYILFRTKGFILTALNLQISFLYSIPLFLFSAGISHPKQVANFSNDVVIKAVCLIFFVQIFFYFCGKISAVEDVKSEEVYKKFLLNKIHFIFGVLIFSFLSFFDIFFFPVKGESPGFLLTLISKLNLIFLIWLLILITQYSTYFGLISLLIINILLYGKTLSREMPTILSAIWFFSVLPRNFSFHKNVALSTVGIWVTFPVLFYLAGLVRAFFNFSTLR